MEGSPECDATPNRIIGPAVYVETGRIVKEETETGRKPVPRGQLAVQSGGPRDKTADRNQTGGIDPVLPPLRIICRKSS